jgi:hypothetical protein
MEFDDGRLFKRKSEIIERGGEELLLFDPDKGKLYELNDTGRFIWEHLDGSHTLSDVISGMRDQYEEDPEMEEDIRDYINKMLEEELIE